MVKPVTLLSQMSYLGIRIKMNTGVANMLIRIVKTRNAFHPSFWNRSTDTTTAGNVTCDGRVPMCGVFRAPTR